MKAVTKALNKNERIKNKMVEMFYVFSEKSLLWNRHLEPKKINKAGAPISNISEAKRKTKENLVYSFINNWDYKHSKILRLMRGWDFVLMLIRGFTFT